MRPLQGQKPKPSNAKFTRINSEVSFLAFVLGTPVDNAYTKENAETLPDGMPGIIGNDMGFDHVPTLPEFTAAIATFSRRAAGPQR